MKKIIGILLIIVSLGVGYIGFNKVADSTQGINFLGIKIEATDKSTKTEGFIYLAIAVALFAGGVYSLGKARD
jgi:hypothetical protein